MSLDLSASSLIVIVGVGSAIGAVICTILSFCLCRRCRSNANAQLTSFETMVSSSQAAPQRGRSASVPVAPSDANFRLAHLHGQDSTSEVELPTHQLPAGHMVRTHVGSISTDSSDNYYAFGAAKPPTQTIGSRLSNMFRAGERTPSGQTSSFDRFNAAEHPYLGGVRGHIDQLVGRGSQPYQPDPSLLESPYNIPGIHELNQHELQLVREIGRGKYGKVYLAHWVDEYVAVKWFKKEEVTGTAVQEWLRELKLSVSAMTDEPGEKHPNILQVMGYMQDPFALVTEFMTGGSVENYVKLGSETRSQMRLYDAIHMALDTARGIQHLHSCGIVHRDIAARNLLLDNTTSPPRVVVSDFGLSRVVNDNIHENHTYTNVGPLKWMSPEAIVEHTYSPASDAYSFAVTMWEILAGESPYPKTAPVNVAVEVLSHGKRPFVPEWLPPDIACLMRSCWSSNVDFRPTFTEIVDTLELALQEPSCQMPLSNEPIRPITEVETDFLPLKTKPTSSETLSKSGANSNMSTTEDDEDDEDDENEHFEPTLGLPSMDNITMGVSIDVHDTTPSDDESGGSHTASDGELHLDPIPQSQVLPIGESSGTASFRSQVQPPDRQISIRITNQPIRGSSRSVLISRPPDDVPGAAPPALTESKNEFEDWEDGTEGRYSELGKDLTMSRQTSQSELDSVPSHANHPFHRTQITETSQSSLAIPHGSSLPKLTLNRSRPVSARHSADPSLSETSSFGGVGRLLSHPVLPDTQSSGPRGMSRSYRIDEFVSQVSFPSLPEEQESNSIAYRRPKKVRTTNGSVLMNNSMVLDSPPLSPTNLPLTSEQSLSAESVVEQRSELVFVDGETC